MGTGLSVGFGLVANAFISQSLPLALVIFCFMNYIYIQELA